jgi:type IV/VI secretion system ImpK/VasF family protein
VVRIFHLVGSFSQKILNLILLFTEEKKMTASTYKYPRRAIRLCTEIINRITEIPTLPSVDLNEFHASICAKFDAVIRYCRRKSMPAGAATELIYPLVALADETLLSNPKYRHYWTERPLQLRYFGEVIAGTKFFAKLEAHIQADEPDAEILEIYFISLALGLKGMYGGEEAKRRSGIMESLGAILMDIHNRNRRAADLIDKPEKPPRSWRLWTLATLTAAAAVLMVITAVLRDTAIRNLIEFLKRSIN